MQSAARFCGKPLLSQHACVYACSPAGWLDLTLPLNFSTWEILACVTASGDVTDSKPAQELNLKSIAVGPLLCFYTQEKSSTVEWCLRNWAFSFSYLLTGGMESWLTSKDFLLVSAAVQVTPSQEIPLESKTTKLSILQVYLLLLLLLFFSEGILLLFSIFCLSCKKWEEGAGRRRLRVLRFILSPRLSKTRTTESHWLSWARTLFPSSSWSAPPFPQDLVRISAFCPHFIQSSNLLNR